MKEIEVKILDIDIKKIKKDLKKLGSKSILKPTLFKEWYFEIPGISKKDRKVYSLRLRSEGKKNILTGKIQKEDISFHINKEIEAEISSIKDTKELLDLLGFKIFRSREKIREVYQYKNVKIMIDQYPKMNPYIEIESDNKKDVLSFVKILGYSIKDTTNKTGTEIMEDLKLNPDNLFFKEKGF